eukprot:13516422-Ditylum_brightwellii.AAC.1
MAKDQVANVMGDLHAGCFHFLSSTYTAFYGALIQQFQAVLGWKQIKGSDMTKCYQQAAGLAIMIADELEQKTI